MSFDVEKYKKIFKNHVAKLTDYGNIKILDFAKPESNEYRIRFLFEEDYYRLHISGDLGQLTATNYCNMTYEGFSNFVNDTGYFKQKIDCLDRSIYIYDEDLARKQLEEMAEEEGDWLDESDRYWGYTQETRLDNIIDDILEDFSEESGIGEDGYCALTEINPDAGEFCYKIGRKETGILDLYMLAFALAKEQIDKAAVQ